MRKHVCGIIEPRKSRAKTDLKLAAEVFGGLFVGGIDEKLVVDPHNILLALQFGQIAGDGEGAERD